MKKARHASLNHLSPSLQPLELRNVLSEDTLTTYSKNNSIVCKGLSPNFPKTFSTKVIQEGTSDLILLLLGLMLNFSVTA